MKNQELKGTGFMDLIERKGFHDIFIIATSLLLKFLALGIYIGRVNKRLPKQV